MQRGWSFVAIGCGLLLLIAVVGTLLAFPTLLGGISLFESQPEDRDQAGVEQESQIAAPEQVRQEPPPTLTAAPSTGAKETPAEVSPEAAAQTFAASEAFRQVYNTYNPGVLSIQVILQSGNQVGAGAGSGFLIDNEGHVVTNNHVVAGADRVTVIFFEGMESEAEVIGLDPDSDLALLRVDSLPETARPLPLADSDEVQVGDWVIAIGNPFGLGNSMTVGVVSALARVIPTGVTSFSIPHAIQTDAAINPGNSGGPLMNMRGEVIGVNAQIATGGVEANAGVGFAIPSNVVRRVVPALIETGAYQWPWLGVEGGPVNLLTAQANGLDTQEGAYIVRVTEGGPAAEAGLEGADEIQQIDGIPVPIGGDVIVAVDGTSIANFAELLAYVAFRNPGDVIALTVIRNGDTNNPIEITVELAPRPAGVAPETEEQIFP